MRTAASAGAGTARRTIAAVSVAAMVLAFTAAPACRMSGRGGGRVRLAARIGRKSKMLESKGGHVTADTPVLVRYDGPVAVVSFNRPDRHNAANDAMDEAFFAILEDLHGNDNVRAIVLRGEGKSFSSGRDTTELGARPPGVSDLEFIEHGHAKTRLLLSMPAPIIVGLKGWVIGGSFERA